MAKMGRPSTYTQEIGEEICRRMRTRNKDGTPRPIRNIATDTDMPFEGQIYRWLSMHADFRVLYAHAREDQAHMLAEQMVTISDDNSRDAYLDDDGNEVVNHDHISRSKLRVETRKWIAAKLNPRSYGDKLTQEHVGKDGETLVPVLNVTISKPGSDSTS